MRRGGSNSAPAFCAGDDAAKAFFTTMVHSLSDLAMEEASFDMPLCREFVQLNANGYLPDERTILKFQHRLEINQLAGSMLAIVNDVLSRQGFWLKEVSAVDTTLIAAPSLTKNKDDKRGTEMHSSKEVNQSHFEMKACIAVDADSVLVYTMQGTAG